MINEEELKIFSRQLILKDFNETNFEFIQKQKVIVIGIGGIGCPLIQYLVATGIKNLTLIDNDIIKLSNLNRQILFNKKDLGKKKVDVAKKKLDYFNTKNNIITFSEKINNKNISQFLSDASLIIDTTDNWKSMLLINKYCVKNSLPLLCCSVTGYDGQIILFKNEKNKHLCLNCVYPNQNEPNLPRCDTVGILGTTAGLTGLSAAQLTINFFIKNHVNVEKLIMINAKSLKIDYIEIKKYSNCIYL
tara:strand:+ start:1086 stop:1826 length:741 start_codon:yes stop_codon:yes gene_type:complete